MIEAKKLKGIDGLEYLASAPNGEIIIDMVVFDGELFLATKENIYILKDKKRLEKVS